jgi:hypothetical protein
VEVLKEITSQIGVGLMRPGDASQRRPIFLGQLRVQRIGIKGLRSTRRLRGDGDLKFLGHDRGSLQLTLDSYTVGAKRGRISTRQFVGRSTRNGRFTALDLSRCVTGHDRQCAHVGQPRATPPQGMLVRIRPARAGYESLAIRNG